MSTILKNAPSDADGHHETGDSPSEHTFRFGILAKATVAMLVTGLVPLILFGGLALKQEGDQIRSAVEFSMQASADRISTQVDEWVDKNTRVLNAAASLPAMASMRRESQTDVLAAIHKAYPWMYLVFTISPDGLNVARSDAAPLTSYVDREYYKDVTRNGKELAWETVLGKTAKKAALVLAVPIKENGRVVGVLAGAMTLEDISRLVANWKMGRTGFAFLVDEKSRVIAHPREEFVASMAVLKDHPLIAPSRQNDQSTLIPFTEADGRRVLGYTRGTNLGWIVAVQQDDSEVFAPRRRALLTGLVFLVGAAVLVSLVAWLSSTMLVRPILEMARAADRMSLGEIDEPIETSRRDELGLLARSLERLRKSMKAALARLHRNESARIAGSTPHVR